MTLDDPLRVPAHALRWTCDPTQFDFHSSNELPDTTTILGQTRPFEAVQFGIAIRREGYNIFVLGPPGVGKRTLIEGCVREKAASEPTPDDWCYVSNFDDVRRPRSLRLPAGRGEKFRKDVQVLIDDLESAIPRALESDEHKSQVQVVEREEAERQSEALRELAEKSQAQNIQLIRTPAGFALAPLREGSVLSPEEFSKLPAEERTLIEEKVGILQKDLEKIVEQAPKWHQETREKIRNLHREAARLAIGHLIQRVKEKYVDLENVRNYLDAVERDILERIDEFQPADEGQVALFVGRREDRPSFDDYEVNLLVDNGATVGAPVIHEDHPSYQNLVGSVEHESHMGALTTDFTLIKAGALHRANGGYLILDALRLLQQPYAWEALKRAIYSHCAKIESLGEMLSLLSTVSLEPEPIPLDVKVILRGDRLLYYMLFEYDEDFAELFKVAADFDERFDRSDEHCQLYAQFLATLARREKLRPLSADAVARVLEHAARVADDQHQVSLHMRTIADVLREADFWAGRDAAQHITARHIQQAIDQQIYRTDRVRERIQEEIRRNRILIDTQGERVGQVNGLSVLDLGNARFGQPSRITATARLGRGEVVDIEREVKLGGAIHSKGVMILSSFLAARYATDQPLSLSASLVFEQSYGMVDGDSASVAELVALMSAIGQVPVKQELAVTGSVNQIGQVQPIGGVNEKIEGFFDVCRERGLTGTQGVLIPSANCQNLMLRHDVVAAAASGQFHIYAIETIDQAASLLTGLPAGVRDAATGTYTAGSLNQAVQRRLAELTQLRLKFGSEQEKSVVCPTPPAS
ncbi:MAG: Lon protease family protein [Pirellulaceae bacterium]